MQVHTDPIDAQNAEAALIARGFDLSYLSARVQELIKEGADTDHAIVGICEGHELSKSQESELRGHFEQKIAGLRHQYREVEARSMRADTNAEYIHDLNRLHKLQDDLRALGADPFAA
jgi:hypothetical protein